MSKNAWIKLATLYVAVVLLMAGCGSPTVIPSNEVEQASSHVEVTFYLAGMNQRLKILWGDWPNKVKQALSELDAVKLVEDEWEREIESDKDLDLLFVTYDPERITVEQLSETIKKFGYEAKVKENQ
jgi:copper chaperone CopZ